MKLAEASASVLVAEDGRAILATVDVAVDPSGWLDVDVVESEDLGLWIRIEANAAVQLLLLRWEYILAVSVMDVVKGSVFGLKR